MIGAVFTHLAIIGGSPVAALVLGCFAAIILFGRFATLREFLSKVLTPVVTAAKL
jgi:tetrahydromethanopterin S-methyltransferase subunit E